MQALGRLYIASGSRIPISGTPFGILDTIKKKLCELFVAGRARYPYLLVLHIGQNASFIHGMVDTWRPPIQKKKIKQPSPTFLLFSTS